MFTSIFLNFTLTIILLIIFLKGYFPVNHYRASVINPPDKIGSFNVNPLDYYKPSYDRLILIIIDALREDFITEENMPFTFKQNTCLIPVKVEAPTVTLPRIKAITTGSVPQFVDIILNLGSPTKVEDGFLHRAFAAGKRMVFYGDDTWLKIYPDLFMRKEGTNSFFVSDFYEVDNNVTRHLDQELRNEDWDMLFLHYLGLDHIGHVRGPFSDLTKPKLHEMDSIIKTLHEASKSWDKKTLLLITGDHGMKDGGGHGGTTHPETHVPLIAFSSSCGERKLSQQTDIPTTLSALFGLQIHSGGIGRVIPDFFTDYTTNELLYILHYNLQVLTNRLSKSKVIKTSNSEFECGEIIKIHGEFLNRKNSNKLLNNNNDSKTKAVNYDSNHLNNDFTSNSNHGNIGNYDSKHNKVNYDSNHGNSVNHAMVTGNNTNYDSNHDNNNGNYDSNHDNNNGNYDSNHDNNNVNYDHGNNVNYDSNHGNNANYDSYHDNNNVNYDSIKIMDNDNSSDNRIGKYLSESYEKCLKEISESLIRSSVEQDVNLITFSLIASMASFIFIAYSYFLFLKNRHTDFVSVVYLYSNTFFFVLFYSLGFTVFPFFIIELALILNGVCKLGRIMNSYFTGSTKNRKVCTYVILVVVHGFLLQSSSFVEEEHQIWFFYTGTVSVCLFYQNVKNSLNFKSVRFDYVISVLSVIAMLRFLRTLNSTGDKFASYPDLADWFMHEHNLTYYKAFHVVGLILTYRSLIYLTKTKDVLQKCLYSLVLFLIFIYKMYFTSNDLAKIIWGLIILTSLRELLHKNSLLVKIALTWVLIITLLLRPCNTILIPSCFLFTFVYTKYITRIDVLSVTHLWLGCALFFCQGHSNSIASVDISPAYIGLNSYIPTLVFFFTLCHTYAFPILSNLLLLINNPSSVNEVFVINIMNRLWILIVIYVMVLVQRKHLFVWSVFAPKLLIEVVHTLVLFMYVCFVKCIHFFDKVSLIKLKN